MPVLKKSAVAKLAGKFPSEVSRAVREARLVQTADGRIDTDLPVNAAWIATKKAGIRQTQTPKPRTPPPLKSDTVSPEPPEDYEDDEDDPSVADALKTKKLKVEIAKGEEDTRRLIIGNAKNLDELLVRDVVRQRIGILGGEIRIRFLTIPDRLKARLHALILSLLNPEVMAAQIADLFAAPERAPEVESIIRSALGDLNLQKLRDLTAEEVTKALKGAKEAAARADLDSFDPT